MFIVRRVLAAAACSFLVCVTATAQGLSVSGVVSAAHDAPVARAAVHIQLAGSDTTTQSGEFTIHLPAKPSFQVGMLMTLQVDGWVIKYPYLYQSGQTYIPAPAAPPIPVRVFKKGNPSLLDRRGIESMLQGHYSRIVPKRAAAAGSVSILERSENSIFAAVEPARGEMRARLMLAALTGVGWQFSRAPEEPAIPAGARLLSISDYDGGARGSSDPGWSRFLAVQAKELGFSVEQVATAINQWIKSAEEPYQKGLAALHEGRFREASAYISESIPNPPRQFVERYVPLARAEYEQGQYPKAEAALRSVLSVHPHDPVLLNNLAVVLAREAKYGQAEALYKQSLSINERQLGPEHPDVAANLENLADLYRQEERYGEAERLSRRAIDIDDEAFGPVDPQTANSLDTLAEILHAEGQDDKALFAYQLVRGIDEKEMASERPEDVAMTLNGMAEVYRVRGMYADAEPLYLQASTILETSLGPAHPAIAVVLNNEGLLYSAKGDADKAERLYKRSLEIEKSTLGPDHPAVAISLDNLAELYRANHRYSEAEPLYKEAIAIAELKEPGQLVTARYLGHLAFLFLGQGNLAGSEKLYRLALVIAQSRMRPDDPELAVDLDNLGLVYKEEKKYTDAEPLMKRAFVIQSKSLNPDDPALFATAENLAMTLVQLGHAREAARYHAQAMRISLDVRAIKAHQQGNEPEAEALFKQALASAESSLGPEDPEVARELNNVAAVYHVEGKDAEAVVQLKQALAIEEKVLPLDPHVAAICDNLAAILHKLGRDEEAKIYENRAERIRAGSESEH
jgi:tetratricopeptide (TPR) repeat protein